MKLPRDISGIGLSIHLNDFGISIANHDPLKIGTLSTILSEISAHFSITKEEIIKELF